MTSLKLEQEVPVPLSRATCFLIEPEEEFEGEQQKLP
jgi:hypothetical protein